MKFFVVFAACLAFAIARPDVSGYAYPKPPEGYSNEHYIASAPDVGASYHGQANTQSFSSQLPNRVSETTFVTHTGGSGGGSLGGGSGFGSGSGSLGSGGSFQSGSFGGPAGGQTVKTVETHTVTGGGQGGFGGNTGFSSGGGLSGGGLSGGGHSGGGSLGGGQTQYTETRFSGGNQGLSSGGGQGFSSGGGQGGSFGGGNTKTVQRTEYTSGGGAGLSQGGGGAGFSQGGGGAGFSQGGGGAGFSQGGGGAGFSQGPIIGGLTADEGVAHIEGLEQVARFGSGHTRRTQIQTEYITQRPIITKNFYVHAAPEEDEISARQVIRVPAPQKHYKIIFIKAPTPPSLGAGAIPPAVQNEEKTIVYVLVKKPEDYNAELVVPTPPPTKPPKPEVYFIKYKGDEAHETITNIQNQYQQGGEYTSSGIQQGGSLGVTSAKTTSNQVRFGGNDGFGASGAGAGGSKTTTTTAVSGGSGGSGSGFGVSGGSLGVGSLGGGSLGGGSTQTTYTTTGGSGSGAGGLGFGVSGGSLGGGGSQTTYTTTSGGSGGGNALRFGGGSEYSATGGSGLGGGSSKTVTTKTISSGGGLGGGLGGSLGGSSTSFGPSSFEYSSSGPTTFVSGGEQTYHTQSF